MTQAAINKANPYLVFDDCPYCPNQGWYTAGTYENMDQEQCQFCYENEMSVFNNQVEK